MSELFKNKLKELNKELWKVNKNYSVTYGVSASRALEISEIKNGSVASCSSLVSGSQNKIIDLIDFYFDFKSRLETLKREEETKE